MDIAVIFPRRARGRARGGILGAPFHARGRQADEILKIFRELWTEDAQR